jgi:hypothetical protein
MRELIHQSTLLDLMCTFRLGRAEAYRVCEVIFHNRNLCNVLFRYRSNHNKHRQSLFNHIRCRRQNAGSRNSHRRN